MCVGGGEYNIERKIFQKFMAVQTVVTCVAYYRYISVLVCGPNYINLISKWTASTQLDTDTLHVVWVGSVEREAPWMALYMCVYVWEEGGVCVCVGGRCVCVWGGVCVCVCVCVGEGE